MSLYPFWLDLKTEFRRGLMDLHLLDRPTLNHLPTWVPYKGICARYEGGDDSSPTNLVIRAGVKTPQQLLAVLASGAKVIALVETLDQDIVTAIATVCGQNPPNLLAVELGNEIDLTSAKPDDFGYFLNIESGYLRAKGFTGDIITGGISRVRPDTLSWLKEALTHVGQDVLIGIHRYSINNDASIPQSGYVNRDEECQAILEVANGRSVAVTEFGYPILDGSTQADLDKVKTSINVDIHWWNRIGAKYAIYYQWLNGPTNTGIDRFGLKDKPTLLELLT